MMMPGKFIAIKILPIESSAMTPSRTASPLGGIMMARPPLPRIGPITGPCLMVDGGISAT